MRPLAIIVYSIAFLLSTSSSINAHTGYGPFTKPTQEKSLAEATTVYLDINEDQLIVDLTQLTFSSIKVYIFNVAFGKLYQAEITTGITQLDISHYPTGLYYVRLVHGDDILIRKLIKRK